MKMDYNKTYNKILTDEEFMEIKQHGSSDYPFQYYYAVSYTHLCRCIFRCYWFLASIL